MLPWIKASVVKDLGWSSIRNRQLLMPKPVSYDNPPGGKHYLHKITRGAVGLGVRMRVSSMLSEDRGSRLSRRIRAPNVKWDAAAHAPHACQTDHKQEQSLWFWNDIVIQQVAALNNGDLVGG